MTNEVLEAALEYAQRGWNVFPLHGITDEGKCTCGNNRCADAGKHPATNGGIKDATKDEERIKELFARPEFNVAIATGEKSLLTVLDVDIGPKKEGDKTWRELNAEKGEPETLMARTGSGGIHVLFKYNSALNTSSNTLGKGIDCRNDGGYIVAPPSRHRSGGKYEWLNDLPLGVLPAHLSKRKEKRGRPRKDDPTRKKYTIEEVRGMLDVIPADDRDLWRHVGIILGREFNRDEAAWELYVEWADKWDGKKGRNHNAIMAEAFHELSQEDGDLSLGTIIHRALQNGWAPKTGQVPIDKFLYYAPGNNFIYRTTGAFWPGESVNASASPVNEEGTIIKPAVWLKQNRLITSMTRDPIIENEVSEGFDCRDGSIVEADGASLYNAYRPPRIEPGDPKYAKPFIDHVYNLMQHEGDAEQFLDYMAHRVQCPGEKPRFALIIAGEQGVGKDTAIGMCGPAIGLWNIAAIDASALESGFNEYAASVLIIVSEIANRQDMNKWAFNERIKVLIAGQPDYASINPKYGHKYSVRLHCGIIITTNHMVSGLYIPADDRRYDVIACATRSEMGLDDPEERSKYFEELWAWYVQEGGASHVAAFLQGRDISHFRPNTGQRQTKAHREVVLAGMSGDEWCIDALEAMEWPDVIRLDHMWKAVEATNDEPMTRKEFNQRIQHSLPRLGYSKLICHTTNDGRWRIKNESGRTTRTTVYANLENVKQKEAIKQIKELRSPF